MTDSAAELAQTLCDGREQVHDALAAMEPGFPFTLRSAYARAEQTGDLIVWREWSNVNTPVSVVDELSFEVQIRSEDPDRLRRLSEAVNRAMTGLGLHRTYAGPDDFDDRKSEYEKTFRFTRKVDKRTMRFVD